MIYSNSVFVFNLGFDIRSSAQFAQRAMASARIFKRFIYMVRAYRRRTTHGTISGDKPNSSQDHIQVLLDEVFLLLAVLALPFQTDQTEVL